MKIPLTVFIFLTFFQMQAQNIELLKLKGDFSIEDSIRITNAYIQAGYGVELMHDAMQNIWDIASKKGKSSKELREENWKNDPSFMQWLGEPKHMRKARRKINGVYKKFQRKITFQVTREDVGRCGRFVSAWTVPYGKVKIRLCRNFVNFNAYNQEKTIIHELGHEAGLLFDRGVYHCRPALSVASNPKKNRARRRPENYAWLAMSYLGVECYAR